MYSLLLIMKKKMLKENGLQTKKREKKKVKWLLKALL